MSHSQQQAFFELVKRHLPSFFHDANVLEIGSLDINGEIRHLFDNCAYLGVDVAPGRGVDLAVEGQLLDLPTGSMDVVVSAECMEHNPYWRESFVNMARIVRPGGLVAMSCATTGRAEHGTARSDPASSPLTVNRGWEYYRNLSRRMIERAIHVPGWFSECGFWLNYYSRDLYFVGVRQGASSGAIREAFGRLDRELSLSQRRSWRLGWKRDLLVRVIGDRLTVEAAYVRRRVINRYTRNKQYSDGTEIAGVR